MRRLWNKQFIGCKESCLDGVVTLLPRLEMSMKKSIRKVFMTLLVLSFAIPSVAQGNSETGLWTSIEAEKKLDERFSVVGEAELRFRNNLRKADRWSVAGGLEYKLSEWLKVDAGYKFISSYKAAETKMKDNGVDFLKRTASYRDSRHRLYASVVGSLDAGRFGFSLRERWEYTRTCAANVDSYDYDENRWETRVKDGKAKHTLRSRLQMEYYIPSCEITPYANVEIYSVKGGTDKLRYTVGADWKMNRKNRFSLFYRYIDEKGDDLNEHIVGVGYNYRF